MAHYSLGIDIGGTFTDLVIYDHDTGARWSRKVLTTHDDPARAVAAGVEGLLDQARVDPAAFTRTTSCRRPTSMRPSASSTLSMSIPVPSSSGCD